MLIDHVIVLWRSSFHVSGRSRWCTTYITHTLKLEIGLQIQNIFTIFWHPSFVINIVHSLPKSPFPHKISRRIAVLFHLLWRSLTSATFCTDLLSRSILQLESPFLKLFKLVVRSRCSFLVVLENSSFLILHQSVDVRHLTPYLSVFLYRPSKSKVPWSWLPWNKLR